MASFARRAAVIKIIREQALEGYMTFIRINEGKSKDYPKYVEDRLESERTLQKLATAEEAFGNARVRVWLDEIEAKAVAALNKKGAA